MTTLKVMHYYTYPQASGGPLTYIRNIVNSKYLSDIEFSECYQMKAASAIRLNDIRRIINEIKEFSPDVLHVHGVQSEGFLGVILGKKAKVPRIIMTVHGLQQDAQNIGTLKRLFFSRIIEPYTLSHSDIVYCVCNDMANRPYIRKYSKKLYGTIHNFIPDRFLCECPRTSQHKSIRFIYVGRVSVDKGMMELEACIKDDSNISKHEFIIVGDGDYLEEMKRNLTREINSGKVYFTGQVSEVKKLLMDADVFIFPSHHENLSIALLEACASGLPCIATDVGGNSEIIVNNSNGYLVPANSVERLSKAINDFDSLSSQEFSNMSRKSVDRILNCFSEEKIAHQIKDIYLNILES